MNTNGNGWKVPAIGALGAVLMGVAALFMQSNTHRLDVLETKTADIGKSRDERTVELAIMKERFVEIEKRLYQLERRK